MIEIITTKDIAKIANVSIATVSRVLNNNPNVSEKTRKKVIMAIESLGYEPNLFAKNLAKKNKWNIAIGCTEEVFEGFKDSKNNFYLPIMSGIKEYFSKIKAEIFIFSIEDKKLNISFNDVDGFLLVGGGLKKEDIEFFLKYKKPVVVVDEYVWGLDVDSIVSNGFLGTYNIVRFFLEKGYKKIVYFHFKEKHYSFEQRKLGYEKALLEKDLIPKIYSFQDITDLKNLTKNVMKEKPEIIVTSKDLCAIEIMNILNENKYKIPDDVGVIGFDDLKISEDFQLTTVRVPREEMGNLAAGRLFDLVNGVNPHPIVISLFTKPIIRKSVKI
ncbi:transcriptional regulator, LacI family [Marinitoga hydrogenitolerans DSM 16785]|uniref:Transcriptional regulator, LacI family n=1 Tax=Marinitoga hydrogenitolerans (strain DSM 16785 / JCM 12826 / AT1271) TaxID=1122195 RepID=A0A1M4SHH2_MARH1|nr:LacI family DNA-binding transcriptional regulator [Marinitoga hydrogenitolerans]SHE31602.1 transcriptional regulator, LacI family [Marinitoga hydrogenitolerans DSM 16785]